MNKEKDNCGNCGFSQKIVPPGQIKHQLVCKLNPPIPIALMTQGGPQIMSVSPPVADVDYCSKHSAGVVVPWSKKQ